MSKFAKRLKKLGKKQLDVAISVGSDFSSLENLLEVFSTVFVVSTTAPEIKSRNLIYLNDIDYVSTLYNIDMIFINQGFDSSGLRFLAPLLRKTHPIILLNETYNISVEFKEFLFKLRYELVDINLGYQIWKEIRR